MSSKLKKVDIDNEQNKNVMITCAVTGAGENAHKSDLVPVAPIDIAQSALDAASAGAAIVHIHVRDPQTKEGSRDVDLYVEVVQRIREKNEDVVLNLTGGMGADLVFGSESDPLDFGPGTDFVGPGERIPHIEKIRPDIASLDIGSLNFGDVLYATTPSFSRTIATRYQDAGVKAEIEAFDLGHIELAKDLHSEGLFGESPMFQFCLGIKYGAPALAEVIRVMRDLLPENSVWTAFGIGPMQFPTVELAVLNGGHARVGLEDNLYLEKGVFATNAQLVEKAVRIIRSLGSEIHTSTDARRILGLRANNL